MRNPAMKWLVAVSLVLLAPATAPALDAFGWAGGELIRRDQLSEGVLLDQRLALNLGLDVWGSVGEPGVVDWRLGGGYALQKTNYPGADQRSSDLSYHGSLRVLDTPSSRLSLTASADRIQSDVRSNTTASGGLTGNSATSTYDARATLRDVDLPTLSVGGGYVETTNTGFGRADNSISTRLYDASLSHGTGVFSYLLRYEGRDQAGTAAVADYRTHRVDVGGSAALTPSTQAGVNAIHFRREPDNAAAANLKLEDTRVQAFTSTSAPGLSVRAQYAFDHRFTAGPALSEQETILHQGSVLADKRLTEQWSVRGSAQVGGSQTRLGTTEATAAGESIGLLGIWMLQRGDRFFGLEGGGRAALLQPLHATQQTGWGASAAARHGGLASGIRYSAAYALDYDDNTSARAGTALRQQVSADASTTWEGGLVLRSSALYAASRHSDPLLGDSASRTGSFRLSANWGQHEVLLDLSSTDGVAGVLDSPLRGDGFFVSPEFQTHSRFALLSGRTNLGGPLSVLASVRYASLTGPEFQAQREVVLRGLVEYRVGQFVLSLEDQLASGGASAFDSRTNLVLARLTRYFSLR